MPGHYAHYRFAAAQLRSMDAEARKTVSRFRQLYDMGAQGPDPLFYYNPFTQNKVDKLAYRIHESPGRDFFQRACRIYRMQPTEAGLAYLYGCLTHFCLDSVCHPFVCGKHDEKEADHVALETEFNRFLMELDGKPSPHTKDPSGYLKLTRGERETAAAFYPGISAGEFSRSIDSMVLLSRLFAAPEGLPRAVVSKATAMAGQTGYVMTDGPDPRHCVFNEPMLELYEQAAAWFPGMLAQLRQHLKTGAALGEEFDPVFCQPAK